MFSTTFHRYDDYYIPQHSNSYFMSNNMSDNKSRLAGNKFSSDHFLDKYASSENRYFRNVPSSDLSYESRKNAMRAGRMPSNGNNFANSSRDVLDKGKSKSTKHVHYDSQLSFGSSRSDTGSKSPVSRSDSPIIIRNNCPIHWRPLILQNDANPPFSHLAHGPNTSLKSNISNISNLSSSSDQTNGKKPQFIAVTRLEDAQAIRAAEFHPSGQLYAIGSNSKTLRICGYPHPHELRSLCEDHEAHQPTVMSKRLKHHKGSIYCLSWNATGDLLATGSNDKTIKLMRFNAQSGEIEGGEADLTMHDGTVRDLCFMEDLSNRSSLLISGGAGDCKIYVTDCDTATPFQALSGHSGHVLSLHTWGGAMFVSGSQDRTIRFWDLRTRGCVNLITAPPASGAGPGSPVAAVCVDPSGRLLVSGHEDANCMLYDIRGGRIIQTFRPHAADIRTIRFSPKAYYLLTGGYDNKIVLTDLQGDLTQPLPSVVVAEHDDKVIQGRWHPTDFSFLTTSADKTATLWALPN